MQGPDLLELGIILLIVSLAGAISSKMRNAFLPAYVICGLAMGHAGLGLVKSGSEASEILEFIAMLGAAFMMFFLGLELPSERVRNADKRLYALSAANLALAISIGIVFGTLFGFSPFEALLAGFALYPASAQMVTKNLVEMRRLANPETEKLLGALMAQGMVAVCATALFSSVAHARAFEPVSLTISIVCVFAFCGVGVALSRYLAKRANRMLDASSEELFTIVIFALVTFSAAVSSIFGIAAAVGAALVGMMLSETKYARTVERKGAPFRDMFVAITIFYFASRVSLADFSSNVLAISLAAIPLAIIGAIAIDYAFAQRLGLPGRSAGNFALSLMPGSEYALVAVMFAGFYARAYAFVCILACVSLCATPLMKYSSWIQSALQSVLPGKSEKARTWKPLDAQAKVSYKVKGKRWARTQAVKPYSERTYSEEEEEKEEKEAEPWDESVLRRRPLKEELIKNR